MAEVEITPRCAKGEAIYLSSEGWLLPCCYAHLHLRRTIERPEAHGEADMWFARNLDLFDVARRPVEEILADPRWEELRRSWTDGTAPTVCRSMCGVPHGSAFRDEADIRRRDREIVRIAPPARR